MSEQYFGQTDQDLLLDRAVFRGMRSGVFVEIGANDGVSHSNTLMFERYRGWSGVCVEADPTVFDKLVQNRKASCLNVGIAPRSGTLPFLKIEGASQMLGGFLASFDERRMARVDNAIARSGGTKRIIEVPAMSPADLVRDHGLAEIDYLSIDTEGNELDILRAFDFDRTFVHVLTVECNYRDEIDELLSITRDQFDFAVYHVNDVFLVNRRSKFHGQIAALRRLSLRRRAVRRVRRFLANTPKKLARGVQRFQRGRAARL